MAFSDFHLFENDKPTLSFRTLSKAFLSGNAESPYKNIIINNFPSLLSDGKEGTQKQDTASATLRFFMGLKPQMYFSVLCQPFAEANWN